MRYLFCLGNLSRTCAWLLIFNRCFWWAYVQFFLLFAHPLLLGRSHNYLFLYRWRLYESRCFILFYGTTLGLLLGLFLRFDGTVRVFGWNFNLELLFGTSFIFYGVHDSPHLFQLQIIFSHFFWTLYIYRFIFFKSSRVAIILVIKFAKYLILIYCFVNFDVFFLRRHFASSILLIYYNWRIFISFLGGPRDDWRYLFLHLRLGSLWWLLDFLWCLIRFVVLLIDRFIRGRIVIIILLLLTVKWLIDWSNGIV